MNGNISSFHDPRISRVIAHLLGYLLVKNGYSLEYIESVKNDLIAFDVNDFEQGLRSGVK